MVHSPIRLFLIGIIIERIVFYVNADLSFGRLDQILLPLYRNDIAQGKLTLEQAIEITASFCLKTCETIPLYSERVDKFFSGNGVAQAFTLGGTDAEGNDVTNALSGLILNAYAQVLTREPAVHVRIHPGTTDWFFHKSVELLQQGTSRPSFFGDTAVVRALEEAYRAIRTTPVNSIRSSISVFMMVPA